MLRRVALLERALHCLQDETFAVCFLCCIKTVYNKDDPLVVPHAVCLCNLNALVEQSSSAVLTAPGPSTTM